MLKSGQIEHSSNRIRTMGFVVAWRTHPQSMNLAGNGSHGHLKFLLWHIGVLKIITTLSFLGARRHVALLAPARLPDPTEPHGASIATSSLWLTSARAAAPAAASCSSAASCAALSFSSASCAAESSA